MRDLQVSGQDWPSTYLSAGLQGFFLTSPEDRGKKNYDCHDLKAPQQHADAEQPFGRVWQDGEILVRSDDITETRTDISDRGGCPADAG